MAKSARPHVKSQLPKIPQPSLKQLAAQEGLDPAFKAVLKTMALIEGLPPQIPRPPLEGFMMIDGVTGKKESPLQISIQAYRDTLPIIAKYQLDKGKVLQILKSLELNMSIMMQMTANRIKTIRQQLQKQINSRRRLQTVMADIKYPVIAPALCKEMMADCRTALTILERALNDMSRGLETITPLARQLTRPKAGKRHPSAVHEAGHLLRNYIEHVHKSTKRVRSPLRIAAEILCAYVPELWERDIDKFMNSLKASSATRTRQRTR